MSEQARGTSEAAGDRGSLERDYSTGRLGREALTYSLAIVAGRAASFIMLPIYTRLLSPSDYGILQLLEITIDVAAILMSAGVTAGVMRFYFKAETERERQDILGAAFYLELGLNLAGSLLMILAAGTIWRVVLERQGTVTLVYVAAANFTLAVLYNVPLLKMQMERKVFAYSVATLSRVVLQLSLNILFLVGFGWGVMGILLSTLATSVAVGGGALIWALRRTRFTVSRAAIRDLRRFGVPYQIATAATFILTFGDRFFLQHFQGLAAVGLYGLAYQFGFLLSKTAVGPFLRAWNPQRFQLAAEPRELRDAKYNHGLRLFSLIIVTGAVGISLFARPTLEIMSDSSFWPAASIVPVIVAAYVVQALSSVIQFGIDVSEQTKYVTYGTWMSVFVIVALYVLLVPPFGAMGAALATLLAFAFRFAVLYRFSQRLWPIAYAWAPTLRLLAVATLVSTAAFVVDLHGALADAGLGVLLLALYGGIAWMTAVERDERRMILHTVRTAPTTLIGKLARS